MQAIVKSRFIKRLVLMLILAAALGASGCVSCLPQYVIPPEGPVPACYPSGHDPFVPMDHNPSLFNPWDILTSVTTGFMFGPPR